ncbi:hypothetical protein RB597_009820 [Gaeumannomyces tritici]
MWADCLSRLGWLGGSRGDEVGEGEEGMVTVAWTCKCGKRLELAVAEEHRQGAVAFATQAAGPSRQHSIQVTPPPAPQSSETDTQSLVSSSRLGTTSTSPSSAPSISSGGDSSGGDGGSLDHRPIPKRTPTFLLLCVKRGPRRIVPSSVNLTDVIHDTTMFQRIRDEYYGTGPTVWHGWRGAVAYGRALVRNCFRVPKTVEYIKFESLRLQKTGTRICNHTFGQIPSVKQVYNMEYSYRPCPNTDPYPVAPAILIHWLLDPGDHFDDSSMLLERLPKKLHTSIEEDAQRTPRVPPVGWGIYIVDEINQTRIRVATLVLLFITLLLAVVWVKMMEDIQGGMGIGQFMISLILGVLIVSVSALPSLE